jgi:hypothetical protein
MIRKLTVATVAALGMSLATSAFAGEVTGQGKPNPIGLRIILTAICAFSGLEDSPHAPGNTQTPHESGGTIFPAGVAQICSIVNPGKIRNGG